MEVAEKIEEKLPFETVEVSAADTPQRSVPVMDVRPPQPTVAPKTDAPSAPPVKDTSSEDPTDLDVRRQQDSSAADKPSDQKTPADSADQNNAKNNEDPAAKLMPEKPAKVKQPKQPREPGVALAIVTATIVVLLLAGLATYAYLKTNNITVF